jgi:hypothetical protein
VAKLKPGILPSGRIRNLGLHGLTAVAELKPCRLQVAKSIWSPHGIKAVAEMTSYFYTTIQGNELDLSSLTSEETSLFLSARKAYAESLEWLGFKQRWLNDVVAFYDRQNLPRRETTSKPLFLAVQDMGSRLMVDQGFARMPGYRDQLLSIIETKFDTRREFCEAAGVSEDMLSHVLKGRKDLSIGALEELLGKIGYGLSLVPLPKAATA